MYIVPCISVMQYAICDDEYSYPTYTTHVMCCGSTTFEVLTVVTVKKKMFPIHGLAHARTRCLSMVPHTHTCHNCFCKCLSADQPLFYCVEYGRLLKRVSHLACFIRDTLFLFEIVRQFSANIFLTHTNVYNKIEYIFFSAMCGFTNAVYRKCLIYK